MDEVRNDMVMVAPSILSADFARLADELRRIDNADLVHVDVMDGHFVPNITIGPPVVSAVRRVTDVPLDVHLMISDPDRYLEAFAAAGATYLTVHAEAPIHLHRTLQAIRKLGMKSGVALNPATPLTAIEYVLDEADLMLLMTVNPGFGGQKLIDAVIPKVRALRSLLSERQLHSLIQVDGGVTTDNVETLVAAGVDIVVAGSTVFNSPDSRATIEQLRASGRLNRV
jgi:ribulose-phosphate 3-epimerase